MACTLLTLRALAAQEIDHHVAIGDSLAAALKPQGALLHYEEALALDPVRYTTLWKAAGSAIDVAKQLTDADRGLRDSLYLVAAGYAERAIGADSTGADGYFMLAQALGRLARTRSGRARVEFGRQIYDAATRALELDPTHDGAHHVLGAWHAEVRQLSSLTRFAAKVLFGGGFLGRARWDSATAHLERAVALRPGHIFHRLELARIYLELDRARAARGVLEPVAGLEITDVLDPRYQAEAARLLQQMRER